MKQLEQISTRQLLETLRQRGASQNEEHLKADADHLLKCPSDKALNFPFPEDAHE